MHYYLLLTLCSCLISTAITRPSRVDNWSDSRETEDAEYDGNDESPEEAVQEDEEARGNEQDPRYTGRDDVSAKEQLLTNSLNKEKYMQRAVADERAYRPNNENLLEYSRTRNKEEKLDEEASSNNDPSLPKRRQSNRFIENSDMNDAPESAQHLINNYKTNRMEDDDRVNEINKRTADSRSASSEDSDSDSLFDNSQKAHRYSGDKSDNEVSQPNEQNQNYKQYYNSMQPDHKSILDRNFDMAKFIVNRDRRQAEKSDSLSLISTSTEKESLVSNTFNEDDEAAIKRHIKKLSGEELEELLNSLSADKKSLLNKIMEGNRDTRSDTLNKREITKKAGAVEENNFIDGSLSELSKMQGLNSDVNTESAVAQNSDNTNTEKQEEKQVTESNDVGNTKLPETTRDSSLDNKAELTNSADDASNNIKLDVSLNAIEDSKSVMASNEPPTKTESKRETNQVFLKNQDNSMVDNQLSDSYSNVRGSENSFNDHYNFCSSDEDLSELMDEESQLHHNQEYKREALFDNQAELDDSFRSLEESFPNNECERSGQYFEPNMAPLIRVKRKEDNLAIKKRAAALLPDAKVAFVPYKSENDDEDNDEGNEFDDDGFYDRTSNYAKSNVNKPDDNIAPNHFEGQSREAKSDLSNDSQEKVLDEKIEGDTKSLGSDTDSVLSGAEGVDDNLMYNSGTRSRRNLEGNLRQLPMEGSNRLIRSTPLPDEDATKESQDHINIPNYQESDAFGALPRKYEGELGRYKRIRRVKSSSPEETDT